MATEAELVAVISAKDQASSKIQTIVGNIEGMSKKFKVAGLAMMGVGTALAGGIFKLTQEYAQAGDEVAKMAKKTGFSTETLSKLRYAAEMSGASMASIQTAYRTMSRTLDDARRGTETAVREFDRLGISIASLQGLSPDQQFMKIALAVAAIEDPMEKAAAAQAVFGMSGMELLPLLSEGEEGMTKLMERAEELGVVFDEKAAANAERFNDTLQDLKVSIQGAAAGLAEQFLPEMTKFIEKVTTIVIKVGEWIKLHPELTSVIKTSVAVLIGAGGLLFALSQISKAVIAINAALMIFHALSGPAGWTKLAASLAIGAAAIAGMYAVMGAFEKGRKREGEIYAGGKWWNEEEYRERAAKGEIMPPPEPPPAMGKGGLIPGPVGRPVPIVGHGGEVIGWPARQPGAAPVTVNVTVQGSVVSERELADVVREQFYAVQRRNTTLEMA